MTEPSNPVLMILILGERYIGKSCLIHRYCEDDFDFHNFNPLKDHVIDGTEYLVKQHEHDGTEIKLQVWDSHAGREDYVYVYPFYYKQSHGIVLCFDLTNEKSFQELDFWFSEIKKRSKKNVPVLLIGLKADLIDDRVVDEDKIQLLAVEQGVQYFETSSKTGENVKQAINGFVDQLILKNREKFNKKGGTCTIS